MNIKFLLLALIIGLTSCNNPIEKSLKDDIQKKIGKEASTYDLVSCIITDTIRVSDMITILDNKVKILSVASDIDSAAFVEMRNQEFVKFRRDTTYEDKIMRGELKDASGWCTELRQVTETADSVIANWATAKDSWEAKRLYIWYLTRSMQYYDNNKYNEDWRLEILKQTDDTKDAFSQLRVFNSAPQDSALYMTILHTYSLLNPLLKKDVVLTDSVAMDFDYNVLGRELKTEVSDLLKQTLDL